MSTDDSNYTLPEGGGTSFTKEEWKRAKKAAKKIRDKLAQKCKHLIQAEDGPKPQRVDWEKIKAERERLDEKERDAIREANGFE